MVKTGFENFKKPFIDLADLLMEGYESTVTFGYAEDAVCM